MSVIVSFGSSISGIDAVESCTWNSTVAPERLWVIGSMLPYASIIQGIQTCTVTCYGSGAVNLDLVPSAGCVQGTATLDVQIMPASCAEVIATIYAKCLTSYTYEKQQHQVAKCSYSFTDYFGRIPAINLQGISTGYWSGTGHGITGLIDISGNEGHLQAGLNDSGRALIKNYGVVTAIGGASTGIGSDGFIDTTEGSANCTIPWTPIWALA